ncbi:hypothetical protein ACWGKR_28675 [Bacillus thuringiensis]|uniref:hypothetical protein n=1 Tax=Bacillus cereus group TaxID=86661 RepID=UPI0019D55763|nr:hypothetical protein [Bacillus thuringiensis]MCU4724727.1 hypothetical protein [Bacillus cereus]MDA2519822.1 hypothetical protein [Bacillus cereus]
MDINLLEQYIEEVISEEPYTEEWTKDFEKKFVKVKLVTNCYVRKRNEDPIFDVDKWEKVKEQGYYMG